MGAIDFGIIVDATVIMVENIFRHLADASAGHAAAVSGRPRRDGMTGKIATIYHASSEVTQAIFFSATIIIAGFLPLFTLSGVEGHIFGPMAKTYAYALSGGLLATFTVSPALAALLLPEKVSETETIVVRGLRRVYGARHRASCWRIAGSRWRGGGVLVGIAALAASSVGLEFLPKLEEGNIWMRAALPPSVSLDEGNGYVNRMRGLVKSFPEVETVVSQHGRPDDGTDPDGFSNGEFFVPLKPMRAVAARARQGRPGRRDGRRAAQAASPASTSPSRSTSRTTSRRRPPASMPRTPSRSAAATCSSCSKVAAEIRRVLEKVRGITDIQVPPLLGQPTIRIDIDRQRAARYGLSPGDINATIQAAVGGQAAGDLYENGSDRHFPHDGAAGAAQYRHDMEALRRIAIGAPDPDGGVVQVPLAEVATIGLSSGAFYIYREQQERFIPVKFSRARPRPRRRRARGAAEGRRGGPAAERLPARLGGRLRQLPERHRRGCRSPCRSPSP